MSRLDGQTNGARFDPNGALRRSSQREKDALPIPSEEEGEHLDTEMLKTWMLDKTGKHQKRQQCVIFTLCHDHKVDGRSQITSSTAVPKDTPDADRARLIQAIVDEFDYESREVAKHFPDLQRFIVCAYKKEGATDDERREDPEFSRNFSVDPPQGSAASRSQAYVSPGGTEIDVTQMTQNLLKENQHLRTQLVQTVAASLDRMVDEKRDLLEHVERLMSMRFDDRNKLEESLNQHQTREAEALERRMRTDAQWMLFEGGFNLVKTFATKWMAAREAAEKAALQAGGGDAPMAEASASVDSQFLDIAKTLEPPQVLTIITTLNPEQQEKFQPMASALIMNMAPEKRTLMGELLAAHQAHLARKAQEEAAAKREAAEASGIKVTVQPEPPAGRKSR